MLCCYGINHHATTSAQRAACVVADDQLADWYRTIRAAGATEALWLATCNRNELYVVLPDDLDLTAFHNALTTAIPALALFWADTGFQARDHDAVRHLMRVAASLDALVVGEPQILGQVKQAAARATECDMLGPILKAMMPQVLHVAKQVRTQTAIAECPVSVSTIAVQLATQIFDQVQQCSVLVLGAGEMGADAVRAFRAANVRQITIANRTPAKAQALADMFQGIACSWESWPEHANTADIILSSIPPDSTTGLAHMTPAQLEPLLTQRGHRALFLIDIAQPRGIDPAVGNLAGVYLYGMDDLGALANANRATRADAVVAADALIDQAMVRYQRHIAPPLSETTIRALHEKCEQIRLLECERTLARFRNDPAIRDALDACSRAIVTKILHEPAMQLRQEPSDATDTDHPIHWLRRVFGLAE